MSERELKPCPFCGDDFVLIEQHGTARQSMIVACQMCGARMESGDVYGLTKPEHYAWNMRGPSPVKDHPHD